MRSNCRFPLCAMLVVITQTPARAAERPNIIFFLSDDHRADFLSCAGHSIVKTPVIAVPTSVGYGTSFGGIAALLGMLNSCASGMAVVNIDNGFGAAAMAARIALP